MSLANLLDLPEGVEETTVRVKGANLYTMFKEDSNPAAADNAPVVFVHGNTGSCRWWDLVMDVPGRNTYAFDLPNFGQSEPIDESDIHGYADYVLGFLDALELDPPVLVCHSLGGAVGLSIAARHPERLAGLVLVDSSAPTGLVTPEEHYPIIEMFKANKEMLAGALAAVHPTMKDPERAAMLADLAFEMNGDAFTGNARALARFNVEGQLGNFTKPVLILWGTLDGIITRPMVDATGKEFTAAQSIQVDILEGIGHSPMLECPDRFMELLSDFLLDV
jgi:pimeloyl-ACP methyl ester carboxylesterase